LVLADVGEIIGDQEFVIVELREDAIEGDFALPGASGTEEPIQPFGQ
jgi:hypothetical protein